MKRLENYWFFQVCGWLFLTGLNLFYAITLNKLNTPFFRSLAFAIVLGIIITHAMRWYIHRLKVLTKPLGTQVIYLIGLTILFSIIYGTISELVDTYILKYNQERLGKFSLSERLIFSFLNSTWIILIWNFIYYMYHFIQNSRQQQLDKLRLETLVKNLELRTIKSHINPHFIFNALNSIRALVEENPQRARRAITELSNILRSSLLSENLETVPLSEELDIVKDYLALEQMRFEERLQLDFQIEPETLDKQVPHMMLQTLVENAIKHGISKRMDGGFVKLSSVLKDGKHLIKVVNSGNLNGIPLNGKRGFGIKSTEDRLNILYQGKAAFAISDAGNETVECKIEIPA